MFKQVDELLEKMPERMRINVRASLSAPKSVALEKLAWAVVIGRMRATVEQGVFSEEDDKVVLEVVKQIQQQVGLED